MAQPGNQERQLQIFRGAHQEGVVSAETLKDIQSPDIQRVLSLATGHSAIEARGKRVHLVTFLIDNSGSMRDNEDAVRKGHWFVLSELAKTEQAPDIWICTRYLCPIEQPYTPTSTALSLRRFLPGNNRQQQIPQGLEEGILDPYGPLIGEHGKIRSVKLTSENYRAIGGTTPLYRRSDETFLSVLGKAYEFREIRKRATTATLVMSDGGENTNTSPEQVARRVQDLKRSGTNLVAAMGFGSRRLFEKAFGQDMGIDPQWILTAESTPEEIVNALTKFTAVVKEAAATPVNEYVKLLTSGWQGTGKPTP